MGQEAEGGVADGSQVSGWSGWWWRWLGNDIQLVSCCRCEIGFWVTLQDFHQDLCASIHHVSIEKTVPVDCRLWKKEQDTHKIWGPFFHVSLKSTSLYLLEAQSRVAGNEVGGFGCS